MRMRPSTTGEELAFLRDRVGRMGRLAAVISIFMFLVVVAQEYVVGGSVAWGTDGKRWHLIGTLLLSALWFAHRGLSLSARAIRACEGGAVIGASLAFTMMATQIPPERAPHMDALMAAALLGLLRAIFVPCRPVNTLIVGVLQGIPLVLCTWWSIGTAPLQDIRPLVESMQVTTSSEAALGIAIVMTGWWAACMAMATATSWVIYGLRRKVREIKRLGQYTLEEKIGEGGMGQVFRARHALLRRPTAVKLLAAASIASDDVQRFESEVQLTACLSHPHTITVYDYGRTPDGVFYYAMELVDGATLGEITEISGPQPAARVVHVLRQTLEALAEAHTAGLVHRDIKPANIMLARQGGKCDFTKVLDFGLVMGVNNEEGSLNHQAMGTPLYMAPEAFTDPEGVDERSDLYAVGAVGYFMLTGTHVFPSATVGELAERHHHEVPEPMRERLGQEVDAGLEALIMRCLSKEPAARPQNAAALMEQLESLAIRPWSDDDALAWWQTWEERLMAARYPEMSTTGLGSFEVSFEDSQATIMITSENLEGAE